MVANQATTDPSQTGDNGRDTKGRFAQGNRLARGNPHAKRVAELRAMIRDAVTQDDLKAVVGALIEKAKGGDVMAARELLDRLVGKPATAVDPEKHALDERQLAAAERRANAASWKG